MAGLNSGRSSATQCPIANTIYWRLFKNVCSLCNAFRPALVTSTDSDRGLGRRMMAQTKSPNKLQDKVMKNGWNKKRVIWKTIDDTKLENFPELTEDELRDLKMGIYQLKQAKSYMDEKFDEKGSYHMTSRLGVK